MKNMNSSTLAIVFGFLASSFFVLLYLSSNDWAIWPIWLSCIAWIAWTMLFFKAIHDLVQLQSK